MKTMYFAALMAAMMMSMMSFAKVQDVGGKVIDENGIPMPFVKVVLLSLPDSTFIHGATTNEQGEFNITSDINEGVLKVSCIGYETLYNDKLNFSKFYGNTLQIQPVKNIRILQDGEQFELFDGVNVKAVFTPGHSPCCVTWVLDDVMFTGDSYIPGVKTVTNLPHCNKEQAACSETIIKQLAEHRTVYPGHAPENDEII